MTVRELIEALSELEQDALVLVQERHGEDGDWAPADQVEALPSGNVAIYNQET